MIPAGEPPTETTGPRYLFSRAIAAELDFFLSGFVVLSPMIVLGVDPHGSDMIWGVTLAVLGLAMIAGSAVFLTLNAGSTPGKAFVGLRVAGLTSFRDALRREAFRGVPFLAFYFFMKALADNPSLPEPLPSIGALLIVAAVIGLFWYALLPFFALSGDYRARWDKIVGSRVERTRP